MAPHHRASSRLFDLLLLTASSLNCARARGNQDFAAIDNAAILPTNGFSSSYPRFYLPAIPAFPAPGGGNQPHLRFQRRQDDDDGDIQAINCGDDSHNCLDAGPDGAAVCCPNDRYCFVNSDLEVKCCAIGNVCSDQTPCTEGMNYCVASQTVTTTITPAPSTAASSGSRSTTTGSAASSSDDSGEEPTPEVVVTISTVPACCNRPCGTDQFLCPSAFGAQCCAYGARCGTSGNCLSDVTSTAPPVVNPVPSGCSYTYQFACDPREGLGCCASGQTCRSPSYCDGEAAIPSVTGANGDVIEPVDGDGGGGGGLSSGAKAGIGIGVAVAVLAVITAVVAFCLRRRSKRRMPNSTGGRYETPTLLSDGHPNDSGANNQNYRMNNVGGGGAAASGGGSGSGGYAARMRDRFIGPMSPGAQLFRRGGVGTAADSEMSGPTSVGGSYGNAAGSGVPGSNGGGARPQPHQTGLVYDYFGPVAVSGPYTDTLVGSPPERRDAAVNMYPQNAEDIMVPVEIDSTRNEDRVDGSASGKTGDEINAIKEREMKEKKEAARKAEENAYGPFELVGSPPLPAAASPSPPLSTAEGGEPRSFGTVSPSPEPTRSLH